MPLSSPSLRLYERSRAVCACCDLAGLAICRPESTFLPLSTFRVWVCMCMLLCMLHVHVHVMCENSRGPAPACRLPRHATHHTPAASAGRASDHHRPTTAHSTVAHTGHSPGALRQRRSYGSLEQTRVRDVAIAAHHTAHSPDVALVTRSVASSVSVRLDRSNHHEDPLGQSLSVGDPRLPTLEAVSARGRIAHPSTTWGLRT